MYKAFLQAVADYKADVYKVVLNINSVVTKANYYDYVQTLGTNWKKEKIIRIESAEIRQCED